MSVAVGDTKIFENAYERQTKVQTLDANENPVATIGEYFYDGDGKRVKKVAPGRETTVAEKRTPPANARWY